MFRTFLGVQKNLLNLCVCVINSRSILYGKKLVSNVAINDFWYAIHFFTQIWFGKSNDRTERHDLKSLLWLSFFPFLFPPKKRGKKKRINE